MSYNVAHYLKKKKKKKKAILFTPHKSPYLLRFYL